MRPTVVIAAALVAAAAASRGHARRTLDALESPESRTTAVRVHADAKYAALAAAASALPPAAAADCRPPAPRPPGSSPDGDVGEALAYAECFALPPDLPPVALPDVAAGAVFPVHDPAFLAALQAQRAAIGARLASRILGPPPVQAAEVHLCVFLTGTAPATLWNARAMLKSLLVTATAPVQLHVVSDQDELVLRRELGAVLAAAWLPSPRFYNITAHLPRVEFMRDDRLFVAGAYERFGPKEFVKSALGAVLPPDVDRVIVLDLDIVLLDDIGALWRVFDDFGPDAVLGMAADQASFYHKVIGVCGFNSGITLARLDRMRALDWPRLLHAETVAFCERTGARLTFPGQDPDVVTSLARPALYHVLPCTWNYQTKPSDRSSSACLCTNAGPVHLLHGNSQSFLKAPGFATAVHDFFLHL